MMPNTLFILSPHHSHQDFSHNNVISGYERDFFTFFHSLVPNSYSSPNKLCVLILVFKLSMHLHLKNLPNISSFTVLIAAYRNFPDSLLYLIHFHGCPFLQSPNNQDCVPRILVSLEPHHFFSCMNEIMMELKTSCLEQCYTLKDNLTLMDPLYMKDPSLDVLQHKKKWHMWAESNSCHTDSFGIWTRW